jgi:hypothetical protein
VPAADLAVLDVGQLRRDHRSLAFIEMPAVEVHRHDERFRLATLSRSVCDLGATSGALKIFFSYRMFALVDAKLLTAISVQPSLAKHA